MDNKFTYMNCFNFNLISGLKKSQTRPNIFNGNPKYSIFLTI